MRPLPLAHLFARLLLACGYLAIALSGQEGTRPLTRAQAFRRAEALSALGRKLFFDRTLSGSGKISCSSCHDPKFAYGPPNALAVQQGGANLNEPGMRAVPSLRYLQAIPQFSEHSFGSDDDDDSIDNGPTGGLTWDGRVDRVRDQARIPLLSSREMANASEESVVAAARKAGYAEELRTLSGVDADTGGLFRTILEALEAWQQNDTEFYPYSSKYDAWLAGEAKLSPAESRGLNLFTDPDKGNCARCHIATRGAKGTPPQFTDYGYAALGVPRNPEIPANSDPRWYDLGLCGPERTDLQTRDEYCGYFMTPSLRNVATRRTFFHNGAFHTLREAVAFYAKRDTNPELWYSKGPGGTVTKFDDLPARNRGNIEMRAPFGGRTGDTPALSEEELDAVVEFLGTLTDGFRPAR
jgi:cytochrome c peroxidase